MYEPKPFSKVLYIDLNRRTSWVEERDDLVEEWLGGIGLGIQLLKEENMTSVDPLSPENSIILAVGPFNAAYPLGSKTVALFKSPLTGNLGESYAGGRSSVSVKLAGYMAIVIRGASETPIYLAIHEDRVHFRDASALWGMSSSFTVGRVIAEREPRAGYRSILRIGPAGEKLVRYASVMVESFRHFGRLGLGAVFGSKKLKAIVISGRKALKVEDKVAYKKVYDKIFEKAVRSGLMKKYHELGTTMNVLPLNELGALPTMNLKSGRFEQAENISGEEMASKVLGRRIACSGCPVACIHLAALREPYPHEPFFYKTVFISYDYELAYALGSMLGIGKREGFLKLLHFVESAGLDAISTGVCFAWATEALEKGLISERETLLRLKWGDYESYIKAVKMIVEQPNEFYKELALGVRNASKHFGGEEFALSFGGNEMPGYHTGPAAYLGFLVGGRHSHLDNAGYSLDQKIRELPPPEELVEKLIKEESWRMVLNSLVICLFARGIYD
ncbi:MAG: aldehyde:ferredoxin oxidoreductase, partial [Thermoproteota archaeon]